MTLRRTVLLIIVVAVAGSRVEPIARAVEDRYDLPGVHDCWGIYRHPSECR